MKLPDFQLRSGRVINRYNPPAHLQPCVLDSSAPPSSSLPSVLLFVIWQQILSPLLTVLTKKLILVPTCRCFKHNFGLEYKDLLLQLLTLDGSAPLELCFCTAGPCFSLLVHHCKAAF